MIITEDSPPIFIETDSRLQRQTRAVSQSALLLEALEAVSDGIVVLNNERQIVHANCVFLQYAEAESIEQVLGLQPCDALSCINAKKRRQRRAAASLPCNECAALNVILQANTGKKNVEECRVTTIKDGKLIPLDVRVRATPFSVKGEDFTLFVLSDIAMEKQLAALERVFFHDIRNKASIIAGTVEMIMDDESVAANPSIRQMLSRASSTLLDEIDAQEQIVAAERGELMVEYHPLSSLETLRSVVGLYQGHGDFRNHQMSVDDKAEDFLLYSDEALLGRVIGNMIKNALEASNPEDRVTAGCLRRDNQAHFWVHNVASMPKNIQLRLFSGSYSTKGAGRGLGTYGMKLLSERYLNGQIKVESSPLCGTTFTAMYPLNSHVPANSGMASYLQT